MITIVIGGASGSGKTGLSHRILHTLVHTGISAQILNMDDYYREIPDGLDLAEYRRNTNFDKPEMLQLELLKTHIVELYKGNPITKPLFAFTSNRCEGEETIHPSDVIIIEGIFAQYFYKYFWPSVLEAVTVNITTDSYLSMFERRVKRDMEQRGRIRADMITQERQYVGPGFLKYTANCSIGSDVYVCNEHKNEPEAQQQILDTAAHEVITTLRQKREEISRGDAQPKNYPNVLEIIVKSHLMAGTFFSPSSFKQHYIARSNSHEKDLVADFSGPSG